MRHGKSNVGWHTQTMHSDKKEFWDALKYPSEKGCFNCKHRVGTSVENTCWRWLSAAPEARCSITEKRGGTSRLYPFWEWDEGLKCDIF